MSLRLTQNRKIYLALCAGRMLDPLAVQRLCGSMKASTRMGEVEQQYAIVVARGWKKTRNTKVRTYAMAGKCNAH